jgi:hypothetical protein
VTLLLAALDALLAAGISALAGAWLLWRGVRAVRGTGNRACGCGGAPACGPGRDAARLRAAATRVSARLNRAGGPDAR